MALSDVKIQVTLTLVATVVGAIIGGVATYFATVHGAQEGARIMAEEAKKERTAPKVEQVDCKTHDIWFDANSCHTCHGEKHSGGSVVDRENEYQFRIRTTTPITVTSAVLEVYRVKLLPKHYALCPTTDVKSIQYRPVEKHFAYTTVCRGPEVAHRPEFKSHNVCLSGLQDSKSTYATIPLGKIDVTSDAVVSLNFSLDDDYRKEVERLRQSLVQVLAMVVFHTDDGNDIPSDPFLITIPVTPELPPPAIPVSVPLPASKVPVGSK